jgi:lipopolysaccharide/colanic/teichoic acid biosynthesis glycosyltransferase
MLLERLKVVRNSMSNSGVALGQKHLMKIGFAQLIAIFALVPGIVLMAITASITWLILGQPVMFRQIRAGICGKQFEILKFRTMTSAKDPEGELLPDQMRTTFATRFLRRTRLDELPQLFSILHGDMAIIGPRPLLPETIQSMGLFGVMRCKVKPGLTGWSQVNGNTFLNNQQKLALDLWYVENKSFRLDLQIVLRTLFTVIVGERINQRNLSIAEACFSKMNMK